MPLSGLGMAKMASITDEDLDDPERVSYASTSTANHTSFKAISPPNSRHAALLAQLAISVQESPRKKRSSKKTARQRPPDTHLLAFGPTIQDSLTYAWPQVQHGAELHHAALPPQFHSTSVASCEAPIAHRAEAPLACCCGQHSCPFLQGHLPQNPEISSNQECRVIPDFAGHQLAASPQVAVSRSARPAPKVTRWRTDQKTTYKVTRGSGSLRVSAPIGSNEAQILDAIAEAGSVPTKSKRGTDVSQYERRRSH